MNLWNDWNVFIFCPKKWRFHGSTDDCVCNALETHLMQRFLCRFFFQLFSVVPRKFLSGVKNPCWYEEYTGNITSDPYQTNLYAHYSRRFRSMFQRLRNTFREHLILRNGKLYRMRCLPYFYIIGQPKCGTTDLYDRLRLRPDVKFTTFKEPHWWTRKRFGE